MIEINGQQHELPCIIPALPEQPYHAHWAVGSTGVRNFMQSPALFRAGGKAFDKRIGWVGTGLHRNIGDMEAFQKLTALYPLVPADAKNPEKGTKESTWRHNALKEYVDEWMRETDGQGILLSRDERQKIDGMSDAIWRYEWLPPEIDKGPLRVEWSIFWRDAKSGMVCKCRPDLWYHTRNLAERLVIDLKTSHTDVTARAWGRVSAEHGYHIQDAFYRRGLEAVDAMLDYDRFRFLPVSKNKPHPVGLYWHTQYQLEHANDAIDEALAGMRWCHEKGVWPGNFQPQATVHPQYVSYDHAEMMGRMKEYRRQVAPESFGVEELGEIE